MKTCTKCNLGKDENNFHFKGTERRFNSWCKECVYQLQKRRWIDRKIKAIELMGGKCSCCGYDKNLAALDFHHIDPKTKEFEWLKLREKSWGKIIIELKKCIVLCKNCHAELHNPQHSKDASIYHGVDNSILNIKGPISTGKCPNCKKEVYGTKYCSVECASYAHRKVIARPKKITLKKKIETMSWLAIGREYGVSDNAVRKWAKAYGLIQ